MLRGIIVAFQPQATVTMTHDDYQKVSSSWSGGVGLRIGPFGFGADGGGSKTDITWHDSNNTVGAVDNTDVPKILAVVSDVMPQDA